MPKIPPERQPLDLEPEPDDERPADPPGRRTPTRILQAPPPGTTLEDLVLESAVDSQGEQLDPAALGLGEPEPLVVAKSPATMLPTLQALIPGPRERARAQDGDKVLSVVKDWVRRLVVPQRLDLDYGHPDLKAYTKMLPILKLLEVPGTQEQLALDILVKTDVEGNVQYEQFCVPRDLIVATIQDLHL